MYMKRLIVILLNIKYTNVLQRNFIYYKSAYRINLRKTIYLRSVVYNYKYYSVYDQ